MAEAQFTKGPWHIEDCDDIFSGEMLLGWVAGFRRYGDAFTPTMEVARANMSLWIAAPDLYAALEALVQVTDYSCAHCAVCRRYAGVDSGHADDCPLLAAKTALARARGEA